MPGTQSGCPSPSASTTAGAAPWPVSLPVPPLPGVEPAPPPVPVTAPPAPSPTAPGPQPAATSADSAIDAAPNNVNPVLLMEALALLSCLIPGARVVRSPADCAAWSDVRCVHGESALASLHQLTKDQCFSLDETVRPQEMARDAP